MRARLRTMTPTGKAPRVDRTGNGRIIGASLMALGPALGHGFEIDGTTLDQVAKLADGVPGRWTHGNLCADGLGTHLGRWSNVHREADRVVGDFAFSELAKKVQPAGLSVDAPTYLMDLAEKEPDVAGVSAVIDYQVEDSGEGEGLRHLCRVNEVARADMVADPAANPAGMFSATPSALAEQATAALAEASEIHGEERVRGFLRSYLAAKSQTPEVSVTIEELKKKHEAELAERDAKLAALEAGLKAAKDSEVARRKRDVDGYIADLKAKATPNAIPETDLGHVQALLENGDDATGKLIGGLLLDRAKSVPTGGKVIDLGAAPSKSAAKHQAEQLRAAGWSVELSADGTEILSKTPPSKRGR